MEGGGRLGREREREGEGETTHNRYIMFEKVSITNCQRSSLDSLKFIDN
jgi:hypothetical protein